MTVADRETFLALRQVLPAATRTCLQETFGVSETTWVKLRDGRPVKASTLERVLARYRRLCPRQDGGASDRGAPPNWPAVQDGSPNRPQMECSQGSTL
jgi:hypothetical protein